MRIIIFYLLFLFSLSASAQTFEKECGGPLNGNLGYGVKQTNDGNYIFTGKEGSFGSNGDIYLIKTDTNGDTLWAEYTGFSGMDTGKDLIQTSDSGFVIAGMSSPIGSVDACLLKTDENGVVQWHKSYGGNAVDWANSMVQTYDGGFAIAGVTESFGSGMKDVLFIRTNSNADVVFSKSYGGNGDDSGQFVEFTNDSGFMVCGTTKSFGSGDNDFYLIKTDYFGNVLWSNRYGGAGDDYCSAAVEDSSGNILVAGYTNSFGAGSFDAYVICINPVGNLLWSKTYGTTGSDYFFDLESTSDGGYIMSGNSYTSNFSETNAYLIKLNSAGDTLWTNMLSGDVATAIEQTSDGGYIATGTSAFGPGLGSVYFFKTNSYGQTSCTSNYRSTITGVAATQVSATNTFTTGTIIPVSNQMPTILGHDGDLATSCFALGGQVNMEQNDLFSVFPNPSSGSFNIKAEFTCSFFEVINLLGEKISRIDNPDYSFVKIEMPESCSGIYFVRAVSSDRIITRKILIQ